MALSLYFYNILYATSPNKIIAQNPSNSDLLLHTPSFIPFFDQNVISELSLHPTNNTKNNSKTLKLIISLILSLIFL